MKLHLSLTLLSLLVLNMHLFSQKTHVNPNLKTIIDFDQNHYFGQSTSGQWGLYNSDATYVIQANYDTLLPLCKVEFNPKTYYSKYIKTNYILGRKGRKHSLFNIQGDHIITVDGIIPRLMENNIVLVKKNGLWGLINISGEYILPIIADEIDWYDDMLSLRVNHKTVLFDAQKGELLDERNLYEIQ